MAEQAQPQMTLGATGATGAPRPSARVAARTWGERLGVALIIIGIIGLIQPWVLGFYTNGFTVLLAGTIVFIIASHL